MWSSCDGHAQVDYTVTHVAMDFGSLDIDVNYWTQISTKSCT